MEDPHGRRSPSPGPGTALRGALDLELAIGVSQRATQERLEDRGQGVVPVQALELRVQVARQHHDGPHPVRMIDRGPHHDGTTQGVAHQDRPAAVALHGTPVAGFKGTDAFTYEITHGADGSVTSTVDITIAESVWYLDNSIAGEGTGTSIDPVGSLNELFNDRLCLGWTCDETAGDPVSVTRGLETQNVDFTLAEGGTITGSVLSSATGTAICEGAWVGIWNSSGNFLCDEFANQSGSYTSCGLPSGQYFAGTEIWQSFVNEFYYEINRRDR